MLVPRKLTKQGDKNQSSLFDSILETTNQGTPRKRGDVGGKGGGGQLSLASVCVNICKFKYPYFSLNVCRPPFPNSLIISYASKLIMMGA